MPNRLNITQLTLPASITDLVSICIINNHQNKIPNIIIKIKIIIIKEHLNKWLIVIQLKQLDI